MPRYKKRKTSIGLTTEEEMRNALQMIQNGQKIRAVARITNIPFTTLYRYNEKIKKSTNEDPLSSEKLTPNYSVRKIFTTDQEEVLAEYIAECCKVFYGLSTLDARKIVYETAVVNNIEVPQKWHDTKQAGVEWLYGFRKRYPNITLRTPEGCSLSRATSFNRHNVTMFYDNLETAMSRHEMFGNGTRVYNLDETNTMTVQKSAKVLALKGQKQVSKVTSAERGTLVTTCYIINALGNTLPPVMIFPRVHFKNHMLNGAPTGTLGLATQSGWMNKELFVKTMKHFITHTNSRKDNPSLLILDNHESHISIEALNLAKDNGVTILTVPPHTTGKIQPLDVGVFGPFKTAYNKAVDSWMMRNPGKTFSIYEVAACVREAHMKAMTPNNICNAFKATGIVPFNRDIFSDDDFAPSEVTNRLLEKENIVPPEEERLNNENDVRTRTPSPSIIHNDTILHSIDTPSSSVNLLSQAVLLSGNITSEYPSEEHISIQPNRLSQLALQAVSSTRTSPAPLNITIDITKFHRTPSKNPSPIPSSSLCSLPPSPHNLPQKKSINSEVSSPACSKRTPSVKKFISPFEFKGLPKAGPRKKGKSVIRRGKSMIATDTPYKNEIEQRAEEKNKQKNKKKSVNVVKRKILESDSDSEEEERMSLYSEEEPTFDEDDDKIDVVDPNNFPLLQNLPEEGRFVLVEFQVRGKKVYYVAKVIGIINEDVEVSFLRKSAKNPNKFCLPNVPDIATVNKYDIKLVLPQPGFSGSTKRVQGLYQFDMDFSRIDLR
ncbi:uncharacterized protein LOC124636298 [Helicoverpa zea]|uniref:uncharacterized protein LOC124630325 n=1 Tax=Helicoverpa zea TaxID=7113 RepID=UPI001F5A3FA7|nr:uncharacterized protein LOC124630325 [Helicoverpa zea]XP_047021247.1 uncharacterized protein LOC124631111 [Helicoverpa zea]XP_047027784.1 uncharacterized protein LOC124635873 [Helicoverpa zea]XP_047028291.1 uncharacterized protein LOC124636298 [Helicoverpa zea]